MLKAKAEGCVLKVEAREAGRSVLKAREAGVLEPRSGNEGRSTMPDVAFVVKDVSGAEDAERLERALTRLDFVNGVNVDPEKGLVAVSYDGGEAELEKIEGAMEKAGHEVEPSPGADPSVG